MEVRDFTDMQIKEHDCVHGYDLGIDALRLTPNKALSLILIEERAISELEKTYSAAENPDEYITVKRCSREQDHGRSAVPLNSPWGRE